MLRRLLAALLLVGAAAGCTGQAEPPSPRLVLLYAPCTEARSFLAPYAPALLDSLRREPDRRAPVATLQRGAAGEAAAPAPRAVEMLRRLGYVE